MCGFLGVLADAAGPPPTRAELLALAPWLRHRGPDGASEFVAGRLGLVASRLAIQGDPTLLQPLVSPSGRTVLAFNGEILAGGRRELRGLLRAAGGEAPAPSAGDGALLLATLVHALERGAGEDDPLLERALAVMAEGMGALALLDVARGRVLLARDRFGVKPLYLWQARAGGSTWFGSELEPLLRARGRGGADLEGLAALLRWHRPGPTLPWADVRALPPRSAWSSDGRSPARERRLGADPLLAPRRPVAEAEAGRRDLAAALARGAGEAAETPVAPTLFLSGGLDSAAVAVAVRRNDVTALTGRFAPFGGALDESAAASEVAAAADLDHEVVDLDDADLLEDLPRVVRALELPVGGPGSLALWRLCARVRGRVVLTGTGGDELLGGYARVALALGRGGAWTRGYDALAARLAPQPDVAARVRAAHDRRADLEPLLAPDFARTLRALWAADDARALAAPREHDLTTALRAELEGTLPALLQVEDRVAAAHGLEARPVFCLGGLPAAALALPADEVVGPDGEGKRALRTLLAGRVPEGVRLERTKRGFPTPFARAARGAGRARALAWIEDERFAARGWWDVAACRARLDDEAPLHDRALFALLAVECWARLYLDGDVHALPPRGEPLAVPTR